MMSEELSFEEVIRAEIDARVKAFSVDKSVLQSYVTQNASIVEEYNGRQVFEMLQNMDDQMVFAHEKSRISQIVFNKEQASLVFRNQGEPFSADGIKSIMMPNLSPKKAGRTIGNKGLGFRSLLNWEPEEILIRSNGLELSFSADTVREIVENHPELQVNASNLRKGQTLPILMFPAIRRMEGASDWSTEIELRNVSSSKLTDIETELLNFQSELLLFLPNLRAVEIQIVNGDPTSTTTYLTEEWKAAPGSDNQVWSRPIMLNDSAIDEWIAFREEGILEGVSQEDGSPAAYNLSIAVPLASERREELDHALRNYLPVRSVDIRLPCLVHATVNLTPNRDALSPGSAANRKIFSEILPSAFIRFAEYLRKNSNADHSFLDDKWFPWKLLSPEGKGGSEYVELLYGKLRNAAESGMFVPCVDGKFHTPNDSRYFAKAAEPNKIVAFFNKHTALLPNHVLSTEQSPVPESLGDHPCKPGELEESINDAAATANLSDEDLAELAHLLWSIRQNGGLDSAKRFLILRDNEGRFFKAGETIYTPTDGTAIRLPDFMSCGFLSNSLWAAIQRRFTLEIDSYRTEKPKYFKRVFCDNILSLLVPIAYFDKARVTKKMVAECRRLLNDAETDIARKRLLVSQLLRALYDNFKTENDTSRPDDAVDEDDPSDDEEGAETVDYREKLDLPVEVKDDGTVIGMGDLLFDSAKRFYGTSLGNDVFLDDQRGRELLDGAVEDSLRIHSFFRTFGVREDVRVRYAALSRQADEGYLNFLVGKGENNGGLPDPSWEPLPEKPRIICRLRDADLVRGLSNEALLDLLVSSTRKGLADFLSGKTRINWKKYNGKKYGEVTVDWSYCAYQLVNSRQDLILEDIAQNMRKAEEEMAKKHETLSLPLILERMGARRSVEDLSPEELYGKMAAFDRLDGVQKFYKRIRDALNKRLDRFEDDSPERREEESKFAQLAREKLTTLWARKGNGPLERVERGKIRYWDNATLSRNILADCWKLEIGHRVGAASVERLFGVTNLDSASAKLLKDETEDAESLTKELADRLSARLVILLAIRCRDLSSQDEINRAASTLRLLPGVVHVVRRGAFLFEDRRYELGNGDLIQAENGFVICSTASNLEQALQSQSFCVAIGEMLGIRLRLADSLAISAMRNAVKCSPEEMEMIRQSDLTESDWILATEALGLGEEEKRIWEARLGRALSPTEESELAILGSRAETIRRLIGTELSDGVTLDIPLGDMDNGQTEAFVRWLKVPTSALGVRTADKLRELRRARFKDFQRNGAIAGFVATELHRRLEQSTAEERRKYVPFVLRFQEDTDWFSDKLGKLLEGNPLADEAALWGVLTSSVLQAFAVQLPETAEGCKGSSQPDAGRTYLDILNETGMDWGGLDPLDRSLAFFPGNEEDFRKIVEDARRSEDAPTVPERDGTVPEEQGISIQRVSSVGDLPLSVFWSHRESSTPPRHSGKATHYLSDKRKRQIGKRAEEMVWKAINSDRETYQYPLPWSSLLNTQGTANDSLHYDISYQTPEGEERFVEVKAFDGHEFFMSSGEYEFAHSKEKRNKYVLALVDGNTIWFIEAPFASGSPFNGVLGHTASDYKFHFERLPPAAALPAPTESPQP